MPTVRARMVRAVLVGVALVVVLPGAAHAAGEWDIKTKNGGWSKNENQSGHAWSEGRISFPSAREVEFDVFGVADTCNPEGTDDGVGAYLYISLKYMNGDVEYGGGPIVTDLNGCGNGFSYAYDMGGIDNRRIKSARVELAECTNGCSWYERDWAYSMWKDNPHTGGS